MGQLKRFGEKNDCGSLPKGTRPKGSEALRGARKQPLVVTLARLPYGRGPIESPPLPSRRRRRLWRRRSYRKKSSTQARQLDTQRARLNFFEGFSRRGRGAGPPSAPASPPPPRRRSDKVIYVNVSRLPSSATWLPNIYTYIYIYVYIDIYWCPRRLNPLVTDMWK